MKNSYKLRTLLVNNTALFSAFSLLLAIIISGVIMLLAGYNPIEAFVSIFIGAFGSVRGLTNTLIQATPLIFTGLAFTFARKASIVNLGAEGQMLMGAMASAMVGQMDFGLPLLVHVPLTIIAGIVAGGLAGAFLGYLKVRFGSNEVIASIMLNEIIVLLMTFLVNNNLKAEGPVAQTERILETAQLPRIFSNYRLTIGFILAVLVTLIAAYVIRKTKLGYEIRAVGSGQLSAETAGIKVGRLMLVALFISGAIAGLAGSTHVLGVDYRFIDNFSPGFGFEGIAVSALAGTSMTGVSVAGIIFGALKAGAMELNRATSIPIDFVNLIQGLVVIFVAAPLLIKELLRFREEKTTEIDEAITFQEDVF